jgi:hypothetical protein
MPKITMLTTSADADAIMHAGQTYDVSKKEAAELIEAGAAKPFDASEAAVVRPSENAARRVGRGRSVSGDEE